MGLPADPIVIHTPKGRPFGGRQRNLGTEVLDLWGGIDRARIGERMRLLALERPFERSPAVKSFGFHRELAADLLLNPTVHGAFDLYRESRQTRDSYGDHICGTSMLLSRRLIEAGVPIVTVVCAANDLTIAGYDHWDTHGDNFNRLKNIMLPTFDRAAGALLDDLVDRGLLDETLVVFLTEFGRTPKINANAGRDHFPDCFSVALAAGGIRAGQVYGSSDRSAATPQDLPCGPGDLHATIFHALGIPPDTELIDQLGRPQRLCDGEPLPLS